MLVGRSYALSISNDLISRTGVGAHRTDVTEVHKVFSSTQVVFKAPHSRRTASLDAGVLYAGEEDQGLDSPLTNRNTRRASGDWFSVRSDDVNLTNVPTPPYSPSISSTPPSSVLLSSSPPSVYAPSIISVASTYDRLGHIPPPSTFGLDSVNENGIYEEARIGWKDDLQREHTRRSTYLLNSSWNKHSFLENCVIEIFRRAICSAQSFRGVFPSFSLFYNEKTEYG
jgi:hypothetical protein